MKQLLLVSVLLCTQLPYSSHIYAQSAKAEFRVLAFFTAKKDQAHISFVHEANKWFANEARRYHFIYDSTQNWDLLNAQTLASYQVVIFLDTRPEDPQQRKAFQQYMEKGGAWMGFHFAAFALTPSDYPQNWDWYHNTFLGSGEYKSNTWRPTSAILRFDNHRGYKKIQTTFKSAPNEWYCWNNDLRKNPDIEIILSIDSSSFPLGTGPKPHEIWHEGYYPVAWRNRKYKMVYMNMGHNDINYEHQSNQSLSSSFSSQEQNAFIIQSLISLGKSASGDKTRNH
jgi:hypothetical protein